MDPLKIATYSCMAIGGIAGLAKDIFEKKEEEQKLQKMVDIAVDKKFNEINGKELAE